MADDDPRAVANVLGVPTGAGRGPLLIFGGHAVIALIILLFGAISLSNGAGLEAAPLFGIGLMLLVLGRSVARLAAYR